MTSKSNNPGRICRWCKVPIRAVDVLVGMRGDRTVKLMLDVEPHPEGRVIVRETDGALRMIGPRDKPLVPAYRVHGAKSCGRPRGEGSTL